MKKIIFAFLAFICMYTSCTNEDIEIGHAITFKVNPATVVDNLYERKAGDLTALTSGSRLNVTLYVYNEKGILVDKVSNNYTAYTHMMTTDIDLPSGNYTAVATSHVTSSVNYWTISGTDQLSTFKITDNGYIGGKSKILGLSIKNIHIGENAETISINIENAGAVALVQFYQWNKYNNVSSYLFLGKQSCDYVSLDNQGTIDFSIKSKSVYDFIKFKTDYDSSYTGASGYFFTFPIKNASFRFYALTTNNEYVSMGTEFTDDVRRGDSYWFCYDFEEDQAYWWDMTPDATRASSKNLMFEKLINENTDRIIYDPEGQSISIK